jgi:CBS-domain-containing membrane protein
MHAADLVEELPSVRPDDDILSAMRMVAREHLPGLVVADEHGEVVGCMSVIDLLRLALPRYIHDELGLARVVDEQHADRVAATLVGISVLEVVGEASAHIPMARPQATMVELAELMAERCSPLVVVARKQGGTLGVVTATHLLELLVQAAEGAT